MTSRSLTVSACFVFLYLLAYTKADFNLREEDVNELSRNSEENESSYLAEENFNRPLKAACKCTGGKCVTENGEEVCKCPPEFGDANGKCKACQCGTGSNCTFTCSGLWCLSRTKKCICKEGYKIIAGKCYGPCTNSPCKNGGTCTEVKGGYKCICPPTHTGTTCNEKFDPCKSKPCTNGGTCSVEKNAFKCNCKKPYSGNTCETVMPKRKQRKLETMLTTMEDNVKAHDRERKRIARSKPETRARQNALQRERRALKRQQAINPHDDNIKHTKCVQTPSLYSP
ncbi:EGF-like domain-containing protein [Caerostris darwini]|uniref:EGF-like domain-containing protein n=1 Tax=Caerostris darwini TaxID=1538125 RepID=A0AAV4TFH8_9ARAC|nr:EGF-like domain-containing protein [Caerostris darwini]